MVKHTQTFKTVHDCILYSYITWQNDMKYIGSISVTLITIFIHNDFYDMKYAVNSEPACKQH